MPGIGDIRVLLIKTAVGYFAQGLECDYQALGVTVDAAKRKFEEELAGTLAAARGGLVSAEYHLRNGASRKYWRMLFERGCLLERWVSTNITPFEGISFFLVD